MSNQFEPLDPETAISRQGNWIVLHESMFKAGDFIEACHRKLGIDSESERAWLDGDVECEILEPGSPKWVKGKLRIILSLEFCPDEE